MFCSKCECNNTQLNFVWCSYNCKGRLLCDKCLKKINDAIQYDKLQKGFSDEYYGGCDNCGSDICGRGILTAIIICKICNHVHHFCEKCIKKNRYSLESQQINNYTMTKPAIKN